MRREPQPELWYIKYVMIHILLSHRLGQNCTTFLVQHIALLSKNKKVVGENNSVGPTNTKLMLHCLGSEKIKY